MRRPALSLVAGALAVATLVPASTAIAASGWQLPDLDQEAPSGLVLTNTGVPGRRRWLLGFRSAVRNVGAGPLVIRGSRPDRRTPTMTAEQIVRGAGGEERTIAGVGRLRYVKSTGHHHWHLLGFDRYMLRRIGHRGVRAARWDQKTGFCLGDRYITPDPTVGQRPEPSQFRTNCGLYQPGRLKVQEGISVGYGDDYVANLEGQYLTLGGLPSGRYLLTHRVNADRRLEELRYDNDAASMVLRIHWRGGLPHVRVLASCPDSARCTAPLRVRLAPLNRVG